jgi:hypothetical protein
MYRLNCDHWSAGDGKTKCGAGHFDGTPTPEQCWRECTARVIDGAPFAPNPNWQPPRPLTARDFIQAEVRIVPAARQSRPMPGPRQIATAIKTMATKPRVAPEIIDLREKICAACDQSRLDGIGLWCDACGGCGVSRAMKGIPNLAAWEERRDKKGRIVSGCKHPKRGQAKDPGQPEAEKFGWPIPPPAG